jgi:hypothetical protein
MTKETADIKESAKINKLVNFGVLFYQVMMELCNSQPFM